MELKKCINGNLQKVVKLNLRKKWKKSTTSKTRLIEIYQNLEKGLALDGRGNVKK